MSCSLASWVLVLNATERDLIFSIPISLLDPVYVCSLTSLWTGHMQMVSCDDAFGHIVVQTKIVFQEFRPESVYDNLCLWQWVEVCNIDCFVLLFGRTVFPLRGRKLCHTIPFFPLYPEGEGTDQYSAAGFEYGLGPLG